MKSIQKNLLPLCLGLSLIFAVSCEKEHLQVEEPMLATEQLLDSSTIASDADFDKRIAAVMIGGFERSTAASGVELRGSTTPRVLVNGSILGHNKPNHVSAYLSTTNNLMVDAASLLERLEYTISYSGNDLIARRKTENTAGAKYIRITANSATIQCTTPSGFGNRYVASPEVTRLQNGRFMMAARFLAVLGGIDKDQHHWDNDSRSLQVYYYEELDFGLYFFGKEPPTSTDGTPGSQKYIQGEPNLFFDPTKPTMIVIHGWTAYGWKWRDGFNFDEANEKNIHNYWIDKGWNIAALNWRQIADDGRIVFPPSLPLDAEKKIYDANVPNLGMRWRKTNGDFATRGNPSIPVKNMVFNEYQKIAQAAPNPEIRLIGHSMGGGLVIAAGREIALNSTKMPGRITLADPYWYLDLNANSGITLPDGLSNTRAFGEDGAKRLNARGVALEYFRCSLLGRFFYNKGIADIVAFAEVWPDYTGDEGQKHGFPLAQYIWSMGLPNILNGNTPQMSNAAVRAMMNDKQKWWEQTGGKATITPADDVYTVRTTDKP